MRKLRLALESLEVESFETVPDPARARGTVRANQDAGVDSVGCTYFCTCTCTLEGTCCGRPPTFTAEAEPAAAAA